MKKNAHKKGGDIHADEQHRKTDKEKAVHPLAFEERKPSDTKSEGEWGDNRKKIFPLSLVTNHIDITNGSKNLEENNRKNKPSQRIEDDISSQKPNRPTQKT